MKFTNLDKARVDLVGAHPFFASIVMRHPLKPTKEIDTLAVNGDGCIMYNPDFVESFNRNQLVFLLSHEAMHVAYAHIQRCGARDPELWNIATDAVINDLLIKAKVGDKVEGGVFIEGASKFSAEEMYAKLAKNAKKTLAQYGGDRSENDGKDKKKNFNGKFPKNDLKKDKTGTGRSWSEAETRAAIQQGKVDLAQAAMAERTAGKGSDELLQLIGEYIQSKVPWYQILENRMSAKSERRVTWSRPNKRFEDIYLPRRAKLPSMGHVVIELDCSGSIGNDEIKTFFGHVNAIVEQVHPSAVTVLYTTDRVEKVNEYLPEDYPIQVDMDRPNGGTDMRAGLDWIEENDVDMDDGLCLIFTDGYTATRPTSYDTIWAVTTDTSMDEGLEVLRVKDDGTLA